MLLTEKFPRKCLSQKVEDVFECLVRNVDVGVFQEKSELTHLNLRSIHSTGANNVNKVEVGTLVVGTKTLVIGNDRVQNLILTGIDNSSCERGNVDKSRSICATPYFYKNKCRTYVAGYSRSAACGLVRNCRPSGLVGKLHIC